MSTWLMPGVRRACATVVVTLIAASAWAGSGDARRDDACAMQARADATRYGRAHAIAPGMTLHVPERAGDTVLLENTSRHAVIVLDEDGEPFLRIGRKGVEANVRSRAWPTSGACARTTVDRGPSFLGTPGWLRVTRAPRFRWHDPRLARDDADASWRLPLLLGARSVELAGDSGRRPATTTVLRGHPVHTHDLAKLPIGRSTRDDVQRVLGAPDEHGADGSLVYRADAVRRTGRGTSAREDVVGTRSTTFRFDGDTLARICRERS